jgi:hypothetical protein
MPPRLYPWCEQKQKLLVNVLYRTDIMIFVFLNILTRSEAPAAG